MSGTELEGKTAIITGAASGIGRAAAIRFAQEGCQVAVVDVDRAWGAQTVRLVKESGGSAMFAYADVANEAEVAQAVSETVRAYGGVEILVNNAGIASRIPIIEMTEAQWDSILDTNLKGAFLMSKHALPWMLEAGAGAIVNTASNAGRVGFPGLSAYCASKGAIIQLTRALALEYGDQNIRVNAVAPSSTLNTRMFGARLETSPDPERLQRAIANVNPMKRLGTASEVAELILFLASNRSSYVTGGVFSVDGGITAACPAPAF
jgi:NAD(P)-dependent dehydrogenase (short-subunit alcohol dehydrogenase family)